ncbi:TPA: DUF551 domain-containing protein [Citrobacter sedlakii]
MTTITREQAQKIIDAADEVITALAGTNDDVHPDNSRRMCDLWDDLNDRYAPPEVVRELARIALASLTAEPVACPKCNDTGMADSGGVQPWGEPISVPCDCTAQPALAVDADDNFYSWFGREWHDHYQQNKYTTAAKQMLGVMAESAWKAGRRAAMLQGSQAVSNRDELPLGYLQGHKDGLEWAAQLAEANHPQTGDWLYDDPIELSKAIRKGPDMPLSDGNSPVIQDGWIKCSERMPERDVDVLVYCADKKEQMVGYMERNEAEGWFRFASLPNGGGVYCKPTHWMPLPAAPQREGENV